MTTRFLARLEVKADAATPGTFDGYGAVFNNIDSYGDTIKPGAFAQTLKELDRAGKLPPMLLQHGGFLGVNAADLVPIGKWTAMHEDRKGLYVEGRLFALETELGTRVYSALKEGELDGLSIGFRTKQFSLGTKPGDPERTLEAVDLIEVSLVTFPANPAARVADVKGAMSERDFERFLREAGGFSRDHARSIIAKGYRAGLREAGAREDLEAITEQLRGVLRSLPQGA